MALLLGAMIGFERQWRQRGAGLQTNALVSLGTAAFVSLPGLLDGGEQSPKRMAAQVISGIGFLGGGVILREGLNVQGLNTAATLWYSGATGTLGGSGFMIAATAAAGLVVVANVLLRPIGALINRQPLERSEMEELPPDRRRIPHKTLNRSCHRQPGDDRFARHRTLYGYQVCEP
jgi:putative Mg2+ transporter-C (MgtC) family protein